MQSYLKTVAQQSQLSLFVKTFLVGKGFEVII